MSAVARIIFRYDGDANSDEAMLDVESIGPTLQTGSIIERNGQSWRVVWFDMHRAMNDPERTPTWFVSLRSMD
jgi:hypothetical protein